ncbi:biosynthetic peptidoglycan transglycosylase [Salinispira pacifica]|uniref:Monofunctional biosynthetic peptidoglycan transglycosylase n=1 Tax=Salinispira pacifica TaxID=1307761 RepID=V5WMA6_9SPIO|nr:biosynthetic peptidoglycan transglycosylase [Salinispira pacifica]AHC16783.1 Monofunctional biosynthetic peptidoglycan transglycosylase [Salinispira pacifica]
MKKARLPRIASFILLSLLLAAVLWSGAVITANTVIIPSIWNAISASIPPGLDVSMPRLGLFGAINIRTITLESAGSTASFPEIRHLKIRLPITRWGWRLLFSGDSGIPAPPSYSRLMSNPLSLWQWLDDPDTRSLLPRRILTGGETVFSHNRGDGSISLGWQHGEPNSLSALIQYSRQRLALEYSLELPVSVMLDFLPQAAQVYSAAAGLFPQEESDASNEGGTLPGGTIRLSGTVSTLSPVDFSLETELEFSSILEKYHGSYRFTGRFSPFERITMPKPFTASYPVATPPRGRLLIRDGRFSLNGIRLSPIIDIKGFLPRPGGSPGRFTVLPASVNIFARLDEVPLQSAFNLIPSSFLGTLNSIQLKGQMKGNINIFIPTYSLGNTSWHFSVFPEDMELDQLPYNMELLARGGTLEISDPDSEYRAVMELPAYRRPDMDWMLKHSERSTTWVNTHWELFDNGPLGGTNTDNESRDEEENESAEAPEEAQNTVGEGEKLEYLHVDEISPYLVGAVLSAEDGSFFFHNGVYWDSVSNAIARNLREGEIIFGASTLSMQLMKNLYLSSDREYSRKLREVLLVYAMEEYFHIPKERILELYLNIVEFGPGIFGAQAAARYYFDINASDLDPGQAVWLASILPSPKRYHRYYEAGAISPGWFIRMQSIMRIMLLRERISPEEYREYGTAPPLFSIREVPADPSGDNR